jgi:hypothetical protein
MSSPATPQRFSGRAGSNLPGRVRRALDAHIESKQRFGDTLEVASDGRLETRVARNGGLKQTKDGLTVDVEQVGEKNRPTLGRISDPASAAAADIHTTLVELLKELRRTGNMRA